MKKIVAAVIAAISLAAAASALDLSAGALFDYTFDHQFGKKEKIEISSDSIANCLLKRHPEPEKRSHLDEHSQQPFASKRSTCAQ